MKHKFGYVTYKCGIHHGIIYPEKIGVGPELFSALLLLPEEIVQLWPTYSHPLRPLPPVASYLVEKLDKHLRVARKRGIGLDMYCTPAQLCSDDITEFWEVIWEEL